MDDLTLKDASAAQTLVVSDSETQIVCDGNPSANSVFQGREERPSPALGLFSPSEELSRLYETHGSFM